MGLLAHQKQGILLMLVGAVALVMGAPVGVMNDEEALAAADIIFGIVCMLAGILMLCFGYRLFKIVMFLAGFFFGYWLCYTIMVAVGLGGVENEEWIIFGCSLGTVVARSASRHAHSFVCTLFRRRSSLWFADRVPLHCGHLPARPAGWLLLWHLDPDVHSRRRGHPCLAVAMGLQLRPGAHPVAFFFLKERVTKLFAGAQGLVVGVIAIVWQKPLIIVSSSFVGSYMLFYGIDVFADTGFKDAMQLILSVRRLHCRRRRDADRRAYRELRQATSKVQRSP